MKWSRSIFLMIILIFLVSLLFLFQSGYIEEALILDSDRGDISGDGQDERVVLTRKLLSKYGKEVIIYRGREDIYRSDMSDLKPWKIAIGDIDGDGISEISIGVYKTTIFHPVMDKRPFIYSFGEDGLQPKWRGSRLSRPFTDYLFHDLDGDGWDEIISIESLEDGDKIINTYKWKGFGFEGFVESKGYGDIENLRLEDGRIYVDIVDKNNEYRGKVKLVDENIRIEK